MYGKRIYSFRKEENSLTSIIGSNLKGIVDYETKKMENGTFREEIV